MARKMRFLPPHCAALPRQRRAGCAITYRWSEQPEPRFCTSPAGMAGTFCPALTSNRPNANAWLSTMSCARGLLAPSKHCALWLSLWASRRGSLHLIFLTMSARKKKVDPPFWLTGKLGGKSPTGQPLPFVQLYADLMQAPAFTALSAGARFCYLSMALEAKGNRCFEFPRKTAERYGIPGRTLVRNVQELENAGFLHCRSGRTTRTASEYEFSLNWKLKQPS